MDLDGGAPASYTSYRILIGDAMLAVAAVFWGATTVLVKASPLSRIRPGKTLLYQIAVSAVVLPLGSLIMDGLFTRPLEPLNPKPSILAEENWMLQPLNLSYESPLCK